MVKLSLLVEFTPCKFIRVPFIANLEIRLLLKGVNTEVSLSNWTKWHLCYNDIV